MLVLSFILNDLPLLVCAVARPHFYLEKGVFIVCIIGGNLLLNLSPSEWFSYTKSGQLKRLSAKHYFFG